MKQTILYFIAGLFFLTGCTQEEPSLTESNQVGYLTVEDLTLLQAEQISVGSRAVDADLYVEITDAKATTTYNPGMVPAKIELAVGTCTVKAYNAAYKDDTSNAAKYYAETTVEIKEGKVEYLSLEVPMVNYGVTLSLPDNFSDWFSDYTFSIGKSTATERKKQTERLRRPVHTALMKEKLLNRGKSIRLSITGKRKHWK